MDVKKTPNSDDKKLEPEVGKSGPENKKPTTTSSPFPDSKTSKLEIPPAAISDERTHSPTTDMQNLVSDLNSFLSSTQKEIHTPKNTKKKMAFNGSRKEESYDNNFKFGGKKIEQEPMS